MALPSSGQISLAQIASEFGGTAPHSLSEYYSKGNAPASGQIRIGTHFHGTEYIFGPLSHSYGQYSFDNSGGSYVMLTLTGLSKSSIRVYGNVYATNPSTSQIVLQRSSNNGSSWGSEVVIASVVDTDHANGTNSSSGDQTVSLSGFNAARVLHRAINQHAWAATSASGVYVKFP